MTTLPVSRLMSVARLIGIDPIEEPQYLWLAREACFHGDGPRRGEVQKSKNDSGATNRARDLSSGDDNSPIDFDAYKEFTDSDGKTKYYNIITKKISRTHPIIQHYSDLYHKHKTYTNQMEIYDLLNIENLPDSNPKDKTINSLMEKVRDRRTLNSAVKSHTLPPSAILTPDLLLGFCRCFGIDTNTEFHLTRFLKATLEQYISKDLDVSSFFSFFQEHIEPFRKLRSSQLDEDPRKPTFIVLCSECEKRSAVLECTDCEDPYCTDCFHDTHSTGNRRLHKTIDLDQLSCTSCDYALATCQCVQCGSFFCSPCFTETHSIRAELQLHKKEELSGLVCLECEVNSANVICEDCNDLYCTPCFCRLHTMGSRKNHVHLNIDNSNQIYRGGTLLNEKEGVAATQKAQGTQYKDPLVSFTDENNHTFNYNLLTKQTIYMKM